MADAAIHGHEHGDQRGFFTRWFMSTNHKDIGTMYIIFAIIAGIIGGTFSVIMRMELMEPGMQFLFKDGAPAATQVGAVAKAQLAAFVTPHLNVV